MAAMLVCTLPATVAVLFDYSFRLSFFSFSFACRLSFWIGFSIAASIFLDWMQVVVVCMVHVNKNNITKDEDEATNADTHAFDHYDD